ncbi:MBL fold metallo-hydrolase [Yersinia enterocolitica]|uniref:MBL fold metallo-hydrolase n=1 Tax=Yersiniaceae TaxID=1903411 RepID=UPI0005DCE0BB|nr:MBL fold metallo-hydrolase [Yersinia enterocolitica]EKN4047453.1 MBL fold metallo-hydrolase [Yersinia enterocolitica]CNG86798.1 metallo-beta-lactamase family protein [Yersinia kristensenii]
MSTSIQILHASHGDCLFLRHEQDGGTFNLLIDGGPAETFGQLYGYAKPLRLLLEELQERGESVDLAIITHVDDDHIGGVLEGMSYDNFLPSLVKEFWFNSYGLISSVVAAPNDKNNEVSGVAGAEVKTSITQGVTLEEKLSKLNWYNHVIHNDIPPLIRSGLEFTILSPSVKTLRRLGKAWEREYPQDDKKTAKAESDHKLPFSHFFCGDRFKSDRSIPNGSSIAFILKIGDIKLLLLADSYANTVAQKLRELGYSSDNPLECSMVKISHHGSKGNTSQELLSLLSSKRYVISTDGSVFGHPDKRTIARILSAHGENNVYFNYESVVRNILLPEDAAYADRLHVCEEKMVL